MNFFVPGIPAPGGSKRFVGIGKKTGRAILIDAGGQKTKNWRSTVAQCGMAEMNGREMFTGPLWVKMEFIVDRPKSHLLKDGHMKIGSPRSPISRPDTLKLARSTEDALTGICWHDDAQTVNLSLVKRYRTYGEPCGCRIQIEPLL